MDLALVGSPDWFPLILDVSRDRVLFVRLDEAEYVAASFLDERILAGSRARFWAPWSDLDSTVPTPSPKLDFIFHIGHAGSTLLSRLLAISDHIFPVREPAVLRQLARWELARGEDRPWSLEDFAARLDMVLHLWSRVYRLGQRTLLKATSFVGEIAPLLLRRAPSSRAILMFVAPQVHIASVLGGSTARAELPTAAVSRAARLHRRMAALRVRPADLSAGELAAMSWACELFGLAEAAGSFGERVLWLDFEDFLDHPAAGLRAALRHLRGAAPGDTVSAMLRSPEFHRYSKAPEHVFDTASRRGATARALVEHRREIERGLIWLNAAGRAHGALAEAVRRVATAPRLTSHPRRDQTGCDSEC